MADIYCPHCGEPWDSWHLANMTTDSGRPIPYKKTAARFRAVGCLAFGGDDCRPTAPADRPLISQLQAAADILSDDIEAAAIDAAEYLHAAGSTIR